MMRAVVRLAFALFLIQAGFHGYTASMPLALARAGRLDSEIGLIVGVAALVQIPAALAAGGLIDRLGGVRLFLIGGLCYVAASLLLLLPGLDPRGSTGVLVTGRVLQGAGIGLALPAALSVVPRLVPAFRQGFALAMAGLAHNLTLVVIPPLSLIVLDWYGLPGVALFVLAVVLVAFAIALVRPLGPLRVVGTDAEPARRRFGFAYRPSWVAPLLIVLLFSAHWGLIIAYLPQRAEAAGANVGLFFAADGIGVLLARIPSGWLADRIAPLRPLLVGIGVTAVGVALLLPAPTTPLLVISGALTGAGAALIVTPILLALTRRSTDADRGSAFALFSASFALALTLGSVGAAPVIDRLGFEFTLVLLLGALLMSAVVALADRGLAAKAAPGPSLAEAEAAALPPAGP